MAVEIWKDVLYPGRQCDADGNWFEFNRRDTAQAAKNFHRMFRRGLRIPAVWEHQSKANPVEPQQLSRDDVLANYAKHTFGEINGAKVDGQGVLWLKHHVYRDADARTLVEKRLQCSPKVFPGYSDSLGGEYRGTTIGHVAATPTPVQWWQKPFRLMSKINAVYLSYAEPNMADENDDKGGDDKGDKAPPKKKPGGSSATILDVIEALRETGMSIPEEVTDELGLIIAIKANGGDKDDDLDLDDSAAGGPPPDTAGANSPPMMMSATQAEPFVKMGRRDLETRARRLFETGRVDRPTAKKLILESRSVQLSYTRSGEPAPNPLLSRIEAFETLPAKSVWSKTGARPLEGRDLSDTRGVDVPGKLDGGNTSKGTEEATELVLSFIAGPPAKK